VIFSSGCRDCERCTERMIVWLIVLPFRVVWRLATFWNIGLVTRKCPQCGHRIAHHHKLADGRFKD
jgi:hypothetical protein